MNDFLNIGKAVPKRDSLSLATGREKFTADIKLDNPLHLALLYSPHAHAEILDIDYEAALKLEGVVEVLCYKNVPRVLHTTAGQGFPEPSPYDTVLFDRRVRFVGDRVALVAAESMEIARQALSLIKVEYRMLEELFDIEKAMSDSAPRLHVDDEFARIPVPYQPEKNLAATLDITFGDPDKAFREADFVEERTYSMHYASHCAIEPHTTSAFFNEQGRLVIITSTQVPFHARRIVGYLLDIPTGEIRVIKPRIGGGFGGKQEVILEPLAALVAWRTKRAATITLSRSEVFISTRTRHAMRIHLKTGISKEGRITALDMDALMNAGAYGPHALTVLSNTGSKVLPLFNKIDHLKFKGRTVYTNLPVGGAYRGYGATQGYFALNQHLDIIARRLERDPIELCKKWHIREGEGSRVFEVLGEGTEGVEQIIRSCKLDECLDRGAEAIGWHEKRNQRLKGPKERVRGVGLAVAMQGSGIPEVDMGSASMKMNEDASFNLLVGATDIGTGSDTILAQIAAEVLKIPSQKIIVLSSDTDLTPFDVGAYASSTTYISGGAVQKCALKIKEQIISVAANMLKAETKELYLGEERVINRQSGEELPLQDICTYALYTKDQFQIQAQASHTASESPPPFAAQFAEVEVDLLTGRVDVVKFVSAVDCGQPINPPLAEGQVEGAVINGISYALCEEYNFNSKGKMVNPSFGDYKIFTAADIPEMETIIVSSYEQSGPFGAKSISEIAINGPPPAIANAIFDAAGVRMYHTPFTPERVWQELNK